MIRMAATHVVLLRGINVGGTSTVPMKDLQAAIAGAGFADVRTYINSGNVLLAAKGTDEAIRGKVESLLWKRFGKHIPCIVRSVRDLRAIARKIPADWKNDGKTQKTDVLFLWPEVDNKASVAEIKTNPDVDVLRHFNGVVVWHLGSREDYKKSKMRYFIGTRVYKAMTARNVNTVRKLVELAGA